MARKLVIVGAGAAGVYTAYRVKEMYGDQYDVALLEAGPRVGGNTSSAELTYGGKAYNIDCGAQFFYKYPQPSYDALLAQLGLADSQTGVVYSAPAGFNVWDHAAGQRLFWMPSTVDKFLRYTSDDWDRLVQFGLFLGYAFFLDTASTPDWRLSLDDWLADMVLVDATFRERVIKPFLYQFVSLPLPRIGEASALYAITYLARNLYGQQPPASFTTTADPVFVTYQCAIGLDGILQRVLRKAGVGAQLSTPVASVARVGAKLCVKTTTGAMTTADDVVLATDPHTSAKILAAGGTCDQHLIDLLDGLEYAPLPIALQKDGACWMPDDQNYWEPINTWVNGSDVAFSAWFGPLRPPYGDNQQIPVFKSWGAPDASGCAHQFRLEPHHVMMPTVDFVSGRDEVMTWSGRDGIFFAGGWTNWFDSQEAALLSATKTAAALPGSARPGTGPARLVTVASDQQLLNLTQWLDKVARYAPPDKAALLTDVFQQVDMLLGW